MTSEPRCNVRDELSENELSRWLALRALGFAKASRNTPQHVPDRLVRELSLGEPLPLGVLPHDISERVFDLPDIFFSRTAFRGGPAWVIARQPLVREAYLRPDIFSSDSTQFSAEELFTERDAPGIGNWKLIPTFADPPAHSKYKVFLQQLFSPKRMEALEESVRTRCRELVDEIPLDEGFEFVERFARPFPVSIFLTLMGLPREMQAEFLSWEKGLLHATSVKEAANARVSVVNYFCGLMNARRERPTDDIASAIANAEIDGSRFTDDEVMGLYLMLFVAGLDTVTAALAFMFAQLASAPALQSQLRGNPALVPGAVEELLRVSGVIESHRWVKSDLNFHGVDMKRGDLVVMITPISGLDPSVVAEPKKIDFQREFPGHLAFGAGPHYCVGVHLAKRELRVALEEWGHAQANAAVGKPNRGLARTPRGPCLDDIMSTPRFCGAISSAAFRLADHPMDERRFKPNRAT